MTWTMQPDHFRSTIASDRDPSALLVRFRHRDHLDTFIGKLTALGFDEPKVLAFGYSDYAWRCVVPREQYKALVAAEVDEITYTNFKDHTTKVSGKPLHDAYMSVWSVMHKIQSWNGALRGKAEVVAATPQPKWATRDWTTSSWDYRGYGQRSQARLPLEDGAAIAWSELPATERDRLLGNLLDGSDDMPADEIDTFDDVEDCFCGKPREQASTLFKATWKPGSVCPHCGDEEPMPEPDDDDPSSPFHVGAGT